MFDIFLMFSQNNDCGYTLEPPSSWRGGSNEYTQSMSWSKIRKIVLPLPPVFLYKSGVQGVYISRTSFPDENNRSVKCIPTYVPLLYEPVHEKNNNLGSDQV